VFVEAALTFDRDDPQYANLSQEDLDAAQLRHDLLANKVEAGLAFTNQLGDKTNVTDSNNPESDPAYLASIKIISEVTEEHESVECTKRFLTTYANSGSYDDIEIINNTNTICQTQIPDTTPPIFISESNITVNEFQYNALQLVATDNSSITYSIENGDSSYFNINSITGEITFKTIPQYNIKKTYTFTAKANDGTNETSQNITINISKIILSFYTQQNKDIRTFSTQYTALEIKLSKDKTKAFLIDYKTLYILDITQKIPTIIGQYSSNTIKHLHISDDETRIYLSSPYGIEIIDISTINSPNRLKKISLRHSTNCISSKDNQTLFISLDTGGLTVIDISDLSNTTTISNLDTNGYSDELVLSNDEKILYIADGRKGLKIIDLSNLDEPLLLGSYETDMSTYHIKLSSDNTKVYMSNNNNGLIILDITNPSIPTPISTFRDIPILDLFVDSTNVYTINNYGLNIINISNLDTPILMQQLNTINTPKDIAIDNLNQIAYVVGDKAIQIIDLKLPNIPIVLGHYSVNGSNALNINLSKDNTTAYLNDGYTGLHITDITTSNNITEIGLYQPHAYSFKTILSDDETKAFIPSANKGLIILDITDKSSPQLIGSYDTNASVRSLILSNDNTLAYMADYTEGIKIINIENPSTPILIGSYNTEGNSISISLSKDNTKLFVADENKGLQIIDVSNPSMPILIGQYDTDGLTYDIVLSNDEQRAYIADGNGSLKILDISNIHSPTLLSTYDTHDYVYHIQLSNDETKAYLANGETGFITLDISSSIQSIKTINTFTTGKSIKDFILSNDETKAYIVDNLGFRVVDTTKDIISLAQNFEDTSLNITLNTTPDINLSMQISPNRDDLIIVGDYTNNIINHTQTKQIQIPIYSIPNQTGQTILDITFSYQAKEVTRKVYINVH
jgi:hypothetical protein